MASTAGSAAPAPARPVTSARMARMLQTIQKALDVSVSGASSVNLRAFFEDECRDEPELLAQLFASTAGAAADDDEAQQEQVAGELGAQALQTLRQQIEAAFHELCARHRVPEQLLALEAIIDEAQRLKIQEQAARELAEAQRKEAEAQATTTPITSTTTTPEELVRAERIRVMEAEKKQLELLVRQMQMKKAEQQTRLDIKRELATNAIEDLQQVTQSLHEATALAQDYARPAN